MQEMVREGWYRKGRKEGESGREERKGDIT